MKRHKELWGRVGSVENLAEAARAAMRGKRGKAAGAQFFAQWETEVVTLERELREGSYVRTRRAVIHEWTRCDCVSGVRVTQRIWGPASPRGWRRILEQKGGQGESGHMRPLVLSARSRVMLSAAPLPLTSCRRFKEESAGSIGELLTLLLTQMSARWKPSQRIRATFGHACFF